MRPASFALPSPWSVSANQFHAWALFGFKAVRSCRNDRASANFPLFSAAVISIWANRSRCAWLPPIRCNSGAAPRNAPPWFDCFDAEAIGEDIRNRRAYVFVSQRNLEFGIDRVVAVTDDGRGYIWHEVNDCGDKAYDGSPLGEDCPERDLGGN